MSESRAQSMIVLCLDSSERRLKTALYADRDRLAESSSDDVGNHSEKIILQISGLLSQAGKTLADLNLLAVNLGPGSFTGLRIGLAALAGLAVANNLPIIGFNAFELMAEDLKNEPGLFWALIHSRGDDFYCARLRGDGVVCHPEGDYVIISALNPPPSDQPAILIGSGAQEFLARLSEQDKLRFALHSRTDLPALSALANLAMNTWAAGMEIRGRIPDLFYLAPSQAEIAYALRNSRENR